ncbi:MAG: hypothetical protein EOM02_03840 [Synergistales bacterium]|nr:hypothetical protein [Synergistales bacterium]
MDLTPLERKKAGTPCCVSISLNRINLYSYFKLHRQTKLVTGYWLLVTGYWLLVTGYWLLVTGYWLLPPRLFPILSIPAQWRVLYLSGKVFQLLPPSEPILQPYGP